MMEALRTSGQFHAPRDIPAFMVELLNRLDTLESSKPDQSLKPQGPAAMTRLKSQRP